MHALRGLPTLATTVLILGTLCLGIPAKGAQGDLPDLSIGPDDIGFSAFGTPLSNDSSPRSQWVVIDATIRNMGPGEAAGGTVNVSFFDGSELIETVNVSAALSSSGNGSSVNLFALWNTTPARLGPHTIRVEVNCSEGDANLTNDSASRPFTILPMPAALTLALQPTMAEAAVTAQSPVQMRFNGTAIAYMGDLDAVSVNLSASVDPGWVLELSPVSLAFSASAGGSQKFTVTVVVPAATMADVIGTLKIWGTGGPGELEGPAEVTAKITVDQYFGVELSAAASTKTVPPGGSTSFTVTVQNLGNTVDSYQLGVENRGELEGRGWVIALSRSAIVRLQPGSTEQVTVTVSAQSGLAPYTDERTRILLKAVSQDSPQNSSAERILPLAVEQRGYNTPVVIGWSLLAVVLVVVMLALIFFRLRRPAAKAGTRTDERPPPESGGPLMEGPKERHP